MKATFQTHLLLPLVETAQRIANVVNIQATADGISMVVMDSTRACICLFNIAKDAFIDYKCTEVSIRLDLDTLQSNLQHMGPILTISMSDTLVTFESDDCCVEVQVLSHDDHVLNTVRHLSETVYECVAHVPAETFARVAKMSGETVHVSCRGDIIVFSSKGPRCSLNIALDRVVKPSDIDLDFSTQYFLCVADALNKSVVLSMSPNRSIRVECGCTGGHMVCYVSPI